MLNQDPLLGFIGLMHDMNPHIYVVALYHGTCAYISSAIVVYMLLCYSLPPSPVNSNHYEVVGYILTSQMLD